MPSIELRAREREPARLGGELARVGVGADRASPGTGREPATTKLPESTSSPGVLVDRVGSRR